MMEYGRSWKNVSVNTVFIPRHCWHVKTSNFLIDECNFSTEGVNKKQIWYWFFVDPFNSVLDLLTPSILNWYFVDHFSTKNAKVQFCY